MGVDALQVAQHVQMQRARLQTGRLAFAQALEVALGRLLLEIAHLHLHLHQPPCQVNVTGDENGLGDAQIVDRQVEEA